MSSSSSVRRNLLDDNTISVFKNDKDNRCLLNSDSDSDSESVIEYSPLITNTNNNNKKNKKIFDSMRELEFIRGNHRSTNFDDIGSRTVSPQLYYLFIYLSSR